MPSIRVRALPQAPDADLQSLMAALRDFAAETLGAPPDGVRVLWQQLEPGMYLAADSWPDVQPAATHPPTLELVAFVGRSAETIAAALEGLADLVVEHLRLAPGNAWVSYVEAPDGQLYVNGAIKRLHERA